MSKIKKYADALDDLKLEEFDGTALLTVHGCLVRLIAAWPKVTTWVEDVDGDDGVLPLAWMMTRFDFKDWARLAQVEMDELMKGWIGLAKMNLIYPDGTLPDEVHAFLKT